MVGCNKSLPRTFMKKIDWESNVDLGRLKTNTQLFRAWAVAIFLGFPGPPSLYVMVIVPLVSTHICSLHVTPLLLEDEGWEEKAIGKSGNSSSCFPRHFSLCLSCYPITKFGIYYIALVNKRSLGSQWMENPNKVVVETHCWVKQRPFLLHSRNFSSWVWSLCSRLCLPKSLSYF